MENKIWLPAGHQIKRLRRSVLKYIKILDGEAVSL